MHRERRERVLEPVESAAIVRPSSNTFTDFPASALPLNRTSALVRFTLTAKMYVAPFHRRAM